MTLNAPRISRLQGAQADDGAVQRLDVARDDALHGRDDVRGHQHRVHRHVGVGAMTTAAGDLDRDAVGRGHHRPRVHADHAGPHRRPVVHAIDRLDREAVEQAVPDHLAGAGIAFLARLEDQHGGAVEVAGFSQVARRTDQHGRVSIVAAAVHQAGLAGFPGEVVVFGHGQRVHVGAQPDGLGLPGGIAQPLAAVAPAVDHRDDAGLADPGVNFVHARGLERCRHASGGIDLFKSQLRVRMQVTPERGEFGVEFGDARKRTAIDTVSRRQHQCPPLTRRRGSTTKYSRSTTRLMTTKIRAIRQR